MILNKDLDKSWPTGKQVSFRLQVRVFSFNLISQVFINTPTLVYPKYVCKEIVNINKNLF